MAVLARRSRSGAVLTVYSLRVIPASRPSCVEAVSASPRGIAALGLLLVNMLVVPVRRRRFSACAPDSPDRLGVQHRHDL
ncbi:hypothetical protein [Nonomuraea helvata]|uniref:hypothetical protein n=1 Tax=Nonomuraea helvata TaxID=37484 RepID=UPI0031EACDB0